MVEPEIRDDGILMIGNCGINLPVVYNIENDVFLEYYRSLKEKQDFRIYREDLGHIPLHFILYCKELEGIGFNVNNLVSEFKVSQSGDIDEAIHTLSLAQVCYGYHKEGYAIEVILTKRDNKSPDLLIEGITTDLKVRRERIGAEGLARKAGITLKPGYMFSIPVNHTEERLEDLIKALDNRAEAAFEQAEMLILDMTSGFDTWNYMKVRKLGLSKVPLPPKKDSVVISIPKNVIDRNDPFFKPKFFWEQFEWDVELRQFQGRLPKF